jgi:hypothetical protein
MLPAPAPCQALGFGRQSTSALFERAISTVGTHPGTGGTIVLPCKADEHPMPRGIRSLPGPCLPNRPGKTCADGRPAHLPRRRTWKPQLARRQVSSLVLVLPFTRLFESAGDFNCAASLRGAECPKSERTRCDDCSCRRCSSSPACYRPQARQA